MIRELGRTVALFYLIALVLLRCIAVHLAARRMSHMPTCSKVSTGCPVAALAALELRLLLTRRTGIPCEVKDVECGERDGASEFLHPLPEKQLEEQCVFIVFSLNLALSESQVF
jgi:hypothetical protein